MKEVLEYRVRKLGAYQTYIYVARSSARGWRLGFTLTLVWMSHWLRCIVGNAGPRFWQIRIMCEMKRMTTLIQLHTFRFLLSIMSPTMLSECNDKSQGSGIICFSLFTAICLNCILKNAQISLYLNHTENWHSTSLATAVTHMNYVINHHACMKH